MEELTGIPAQRVVGSRLGTLDEPWHGLLQDFIERPDEHLHKQRLSLDGETRWLNLHKAAIDEPLAPGNSGLVLLVEDQTETQLLEDKLVHSERLASIGRLAAGVAHEIGNPLNSITIHLQLIQRQLAKLEKSPESSRIRKSIEVCTDEVERLHGIITHFLQAVRPSPPDLQETNLLELLEEVLGFQKTELDNRKIRVDVEINEDLPLVMGDRNQLKQVFFNLVKNAMEAMKQDGRLKVKTRSDDDFVYLQIGDSGEGISQEDVRRVFEAYYTTKKEGHGLGLMIVERIMRNHGGQVSIESEPGVGTIVSLQFPQKDRRVRLLKN